MVYNPNAYRMPNVLTGVAGEIESVMHWPLTDGQLRQMGRTGQLDGATDCLLAFDQIKAGGKYNTRRVRYNGRFYIEYGRAQSGRVYIAGALSWRVLDVVTRVYWRREYDERESEAGNVQIGVDGASSRLYMY